METITRIHAQGGLAVAAHPHLMKSEWAKETLYLWDHQDKFAPVIDAWEIANRNNLFTPVSLRRLPFLANSDFHKPKAHLFVEDAVELREGAGGHQGVHPPQ